MPLREIRLELTKEQEERLYRGSRLDAVNTIRPQIHLGLRETVQIVDQIRAGELRVVKGTPSEPCSHCGGTGAEPAP
jgi:hypothetical protein